MENMGGGKGKGLLFAPFRLRGISFDKYISPFHSAEIPLPSLLEFNRH